MSECILCRVDAVECDPQTHRSLYFIIGKNGHEAMPLCEPHVRNQAFALATLAIVTGHEQYAEPLREAVKAPALRLVPSPPNSGAQGEKDG